MALNCFVSHYFAKSVVFTTKNHALAKEGRTPQKHGIIGRFEKGKNYD